MQIPRIQIHQEFVRVKLSQEHVKVRINQDRCWEEVNLGSTDYLVRSSAQRGYEQVLRYIQKTAENGNRLARIEDGGQPIIDICIEEAFPTYDYNVDIIPKSRPEIYFEGGKVYIAFEMGKVDVRV